MYEDLKPLVPRILQALDMLTAGEFIQIEATE